MAEVGLLFFSGELLIELPALVEPVGTLPCGSVFNLCLQVGCRLLEIVHVVSQGLNWDCASQLGVLIKLRLILLFSRRLVLLDK
jgi:hypothetical protein